jgi:hypothetical protein
MAYDRTDKITHKNYMPDDETLFVDYLGTRRWSKTALSQNQDPLEYRKTMLKKYIQANSLREPNKFTVAGTERAEKILSKLERGK